MTMTAIIFAAVALVVIIIIAKTAVVVPHTGGRTCITEPISAPASNTAARWVFISFADLPLACRRSSGSSISL